MAGLDPAIHVFPDRETKDVDARDKPGHDELLLKAPNPDTRLRPAARGARAFAINFRPLDQRAWGMPGARCTRSLVCAWGSKYAHEYSQRAIGKHPTFPHAMVYGLYRALPGDRLSCHRRYAD
ncbi:hypothetical protein SAMN05443248_0958 [Bradyrhizobium erythrophlei]|uniref:Uncharacterized protein n=1 Tax=Bradyrhizobium erythrophlei TaxID=1437360 RepID=A0A1M5IG91_9BRAD|nr:hypothetical protein SAMN05443248_0958 [Bradyrhizobium erythrophlei]